MVGEKCCQGLSLLLCFCGYFLSFFVLFNQNDFLFLFCQKNDLVFPPLKQLTLSVINLDAMSACYG